MAKIDYHNSNYPQIQSNMKIPIVLILTSFWIIIQADDDDNDNGPPSYIGCNKLSYHDCLKNCYCAICYDAQNKTLNTFIVKYLMISTSDLSDLYVICRKQGNTVDPDPKLITKCKTEIEENENERDLVLLIIGVTLGGLFTCSGSIACIDYVIKERITCRDICRGPKNLFKRIIDRIKRMRPSSYSTLN